MRTKLVFLSLSGAAAIVQPRSFLPQMRMGTPSLAPPYGQGTRVCIVGGGPAGALAALYLAHPSRGFHVDVFETMTEEELARRTSRSYNVVIFRRGLEALQLAGVDLQDQVIASNAVRLSGNVRHSTVDDTVKINKGFAQAISMERGDLAYTILTKASQLPNVRFFYGHQLQSVDLPSRCVHYQDPPPSDKDCYHRPLLVRWFRRSYDLSALSTCRGVHICFGYYIVHVIIALLHLVQSMPSLTLFSCDHSSATFEVLGGEEKKFEYDMILGADGVNSRVRQALVDGSLDFVVRKRQDFMEFKTFTVGRIMDLPGAQDGWDSCFHVWKSSVGDILGPPRADGSFSGTCILPREGENSFKSLMQAPADVQSFFSKNYPSVFGDKGPSSEFVEEFFKQRPSYMKSTYCSRLTQGCVALVGDAAHSMWASLGQGVNAAMEDCQVLAEVLDSWASQAEGTGGAFNISASLEAYNDRRLDDAIAVTELSEVGVSRSSPTIKSGFIVTLLFHRFLGFLAPKVFREPILMSISKPGVSYSEIKRGAQKEARRGAAVVLVVLAVGVTAIVRRVVPLVLAAFRPG
ncbi:unnamed protein product [Choristocarpus tenellus]